MRGCFRIDKFKMILALLFFILLIEFIIGFNYGKLEDAVSSQSNNAVENTQGERVPILMFHTFCKDNENPVDIHMLKMKDFKNTLEMLYNNGFRLISLNDFLSGEIDVPSGYKPVILTFDDGLGNQFALERKKRKLKVDPDSAAGALIDFCRKNPDFGRPRATFFLNMNIEVFGNVGTFKQRLKKLVKNGFEIGNHTYSHKTVKQMNGPLELEKELGQNQYELNKYLPGYKMNAFALPCGYECKSDEYFNKIRAGSFEGVDYENKGVLLAGWRPTLLPSSENFKWNKLERIEVTSVKRKFDLSYWLENQKEANFYSKE